MGQLQLIVERLLEKIPQPELTAKLGKLTAEINPLGAQARFLRLLERQKNRGRVELQNGALDSLKESWLERVREAGVAGMLGDKEAFTIANLAVETAERTGETWSVPDNPLLIRQVIKGASVTLINQSANLAEPGRGGTTREIISQLDWPTLEKIWGSPQKVVDALKKAEEHVTAAPLTEAQRAVFELAWEYWAGRTDEPFKEEEKIDITISYGKKTLWQIERLLKERGGGESREDLCTKALRREHAAPSVGPVRGFVPNPPPYVHSCSVRVKVNSHQKAWAKHMAEHYEATIEDTWRTILTAGLDQLERESGNSNSRQEELPR